MRYYEGESGVRCKRCGAPNADVEFELCQLCVGDFGEEDEDEDDYMERCLLEEDNYDYEM